MRPRQLFYGWFEPRNQSGDGEYKLSRRPPDAPTRPVFASSHDRAALETYAAKKRGKIMWWPPLRQDQLTRSA